MEEKEKAKEERRNKDRTIKEIKVTIEKMERSKSAEPPAMVQDRLFCDWMKPMDGALALAWLKGPPSAQKKKKHRVQKGMVP